jgi:HEPN domain-containing protein
MAFGDLLGARALLTVPEVPAREAAFLADQAAEKALKAAIASMGIEPPWTHDLVGLRSHAPQPVIAGTLALDIVALSAAAVAARYPDEGDPPYEHDEVERLVAIAAEILDVVRAYLETNGLDPASMRPA